MTPDTHNKFVKRNTMDGRVVEMRVINGMHAMSPLKSGEELIWIDRHGTLYPVNENGECDCIKQDVQEALHDWWDRIKPEPATSPEYAYYWTSGEPPVGSTDWRKMGRLVWSVADRTAGLPFGTTHLMKVETATDEIIGRAGIKGGKLPTEFYAPNRDDVRHTVPEALQDMLDRKIQVLKPGDPVNPVALDPYAPVKHTVWMDHRGTAYDTEAQARAANVKWAVEDAVDEIVKGDKPAVHSALVNFFVACHPDLVREMLAIFEKNEN